jgi:hypothetical protein
MPAKHAAKSQTQAGIHNAVSCLLLLLLLRLLLPLFPPVR